MASSAGTAIAAATPADIPTGIRNGARPCARRWTGCATPSRRRSKATGREFFRDPWAARNDYIDVILDRSAGKRGALLRETRRA